MGTINKSNVVNGNTIQAQDVLNIVEALDGTSVNKIAISGSVELGTSNIANASGSFAQGSNNNASGSYSHAQGEQSLAQGDYSHAEGYSAETIGLYSHAEGYNTTAFDNASHAEGFGTTAYGLYSHAEGYQTVASGARSHAEGSNTVSSGQGSHAEGIETIANGTYSHAEGFQTLASSSYSHAEGYQTVAYGLYSHAEGNNTIASGSGQTVIGKYNIADTSSLFIIGKGVSGSRANALLVNASGNLQYTDGNQGAGKVLTSDANGIATWQTSSGASTIYMSSSVIPMGNSTHNGLTSGSWAFSGSTLYPLTDSSSIGISGSNRVGTIYMSSTIDYLSNLSLKENGTERLKITGSNLTITASVSISGSITGSGIVLTGNTLTPQIKLVNSALTTTAQTGSLEFSGSVLYFTPDTTRLTLLSNKGGTDNLFTGRNVGNNTLTGDSNTIFGTDMGSGLTSGYDNVLIGRGISSTLTSGAGNVFIGQIQHTNVNGAIAIGQYIGLSTGLSTFSVQIGNGINQNGVLPTTPVIMIGAGGITSTSTSSYSIGIGYNHNITSGSQCVIGGEASAFQLSEIILFGSEGVRYDRSQTKTMSLRLPSMYNYTGSTPNLVAHEFRIQGAQSTGTGTGGDISIWTTSVSGSSGTVINSFTKRFTFKGAEATLEVADATNFRFSGSVGGKLGDSSTNKIGKWGATPIVQPSSSVATASFVAGAGTAVNDLSTFDGYTIGQLVRALRLGGNLA